MTQNMNTVRPLVADVSASWGTDVGGDDYLIIYTTRADNGWTNEHQFVSPDDLETWFDTVNLDIPENLRMQLRECAHPRRDKQDILVGRALDPMRDDAILALLDHNHPPVFFQQGGTVTEVYRNEKSVHVLRPVNQTRMLERMADTANWVRASQAGPTPTKPDGTVASVLLTSPDLRLPPIEAITEIPVLRPDGKFTMRRDYDPMAKVYFAPSTRLGWLKVPDDPTRDDVRAALGLLKEMVGEFPFVNHADQVNALAFMLTPILRPVIDGPTPLAAVSAPKAGTGKTLLVSSIVRLLTGRDVGFVSLGRDDDEANKRLTTFFLNGSQFVILDNVNGPLDQASLKEAITAPVWTGRIIGSSRWVNVPVRVTWAATGNNLVMDREMTRRAYLIGLDAEEDHPEDRGPFTHNLDSWVPENRTRLLEALLTVVAAWSRNGMPRASSPVMGSFESWSAVVGGVLGNAGVVDFLGNETRKRDSVQDDEADTWEPLFAEWHAWVGENEVAAKEVMTRADTPNALLELLPLPDRVTRFDASAPRTFADELRRRKDAVFGPYKLVMCEKDHKRGRLWKVLRVG